MASADTILANCQPRSQTIELGPPKQCWYSEMETLRQSTVHCVRTHPQISKMCKIKKISPASVSFHFVGKGPLCTKHSLRHFLTKHSCISFLAYRPALYNATKSSKMLVQPVITFIKREKFTFLNHNSPNIHTTKVTFENIFFYLCDAVLAIMRLPST